jgi:PPOX class probable F420-dependent enzyme
LRIVAEARRAVLATIGPDGVPRTVPICFAVRAGEVVTALDHKPKGESRPARLTNITADARVTVLFDRYDDDWALLGWVMVRGRARIEPPGAASAVLAARYPQYAERPPAGEVIAISPERIAWWTWR